jgi:hypothetical protein
MKSPRPTKRAAKPAEKTAPQSVSNAAAAPASAAWSLPNNDDFSSARATLLRIGEIDRRLRAVMPDGASTPARASTPPPRESSSGTRRGRSSEQRIAGSGSE